jgi:hypothetical protein
MYVLKGALAQAEAEAEAAVLLLAVGLEVSVLPDAAASYRTLSRRNHLPAFVLVERFVVFLFLAIDL